jgi:hypothetical protein
MVLYAKYSGRVPEDLFEVVTVNAVGDGQGEKFWPIDKAPEKQAPIVDLVFFEDSQDDYGSQQCKYLRECDGCLGLYPGLEIFQKPDHPFIIGFAGINVIKDGLVPTEQNLLIHFGNKIDGVARVIAAGMTDDPALFRQAFIKPGIVWGNQQTYHGRNNSALLDKIDLALKNTGCIIVKTNNESGHDFHAA